MGHHLLLDDEGSELDLEARLAGLVMANRPENRMKWARWWKGNGGKVVGILSPLVPEEILYAAGILPWRVSGTWEGNLDLALTHRSARSCSFSTHVLQAALQGEFDFLDGIVACDEDQELIHLWDVWVNSKALPFQHLLHVPFTESESSCRYLTGEIEAFKDRVEEFSGGKVTDDALWASITAYNRGRGLLKSLYGLRKREIPSVTGAEALGMVLAMTVTDRRQFNSELEEMLPWLESRTAPIGKTRPRLLISADKLDNPAYVELIEGLGCCVAMDDLDTGSRYFWQAVDTSGDSPLASLAKRYLTGVNQPRTASWEKQVAQLADWFTEYRIDAILELPLVHSIPREMRSRLLSSEMTRRGIPYYKIQREYSMSGVGQFRTRIEAILEALGAI